MLALLLAAATTQDNASVAQLRLDAVSSAWRTCVEQRAHAIMASPGNEPLDAQSATQAGMEFCAEFERDFRSAMYSYDPELLRKQGVKSSSPDVVNMLADDTLALMMKTISDETSTKLAQR